MVCPTEIDLHFPILSFSSHHFPTIHRDDEGSHRRTVGRISKAHHIRQTAYVCRDRFGAICVSANGETVHGVDNNKNVKHSRRFGNTSTVLESGAYVFVCLSVCVWRPCSS